MKKINSYLKSNFFTGLLMASFLIVPLESCAGNSASFENDEITNVKVDESLPTDTPQKSKKKKGRAKQKTMNTKLVAVPVSVWGATGIILNVEEKGVIIQYECADGQIEQSLMMNEQGNFEAAGIHSPQRPGPIRVDAKLASQPARYEGKISGDTMTLKVTLTETKEVVGEYTLERGKTPRMTRCY